MEGKIPFNIRANSKDIHGFEIPLSGHKIWVFSCEWNTKTLPFWVNKIFIRKLKILTIVHKIQSFVWKTKFYQMWNSIKIEVSSKETSAFNEISLQNEISSKTKAIKVEVSSKLIFNQSRA